MGTDGGGKGSGSVSTPLEVLSNFCAGLWFVILILTLTQSLILSRSTVTPLSLQQKNTYKTTCVLQISDLTIHIET